MLISFLATPASGSELYPQPPNDLYFQTADCSGPAYVDVGDDGMPPVFAAQTLRWYILPGGTGALYTTPPIGPAVNNLNMYSSTSGVKCWTFNSGMDGTFLPVAVLPYTQTLSFNLPVATPFRLEPAS